MLRVMSFNIRNSSAADGRNAWTNRRDLWTATVRAFDSDLLGVQEVLADQYEHIREVFPDYKCAGVARDDGAERGERALILYRAARFEKLDGGDFWLSRNPDAPGSRSWGAGCVRICTWVRLLDRATDHQIVHANTHFDDRSA